MNWEEEDTRIHKVVINHEEQYSIWPEGRENPKGWYDVGKSGLKQECLDYIEEVWTDMRPLSLRKAMEDAAQNRPLPLPDASAEQQVSIGDELVDFLADGFHPLEASIRPTATVALLKECLNRKYVPVKFTDTRGGTELGIPVDLEASDWSKADFENEKGNVHVEGEFILNYVRVRCVADIDLETLKGQGYLVSIEMVTPEQTLSLET